MAFETAFVIVCGTECGTECGMNCGTANEMVRGTRFFSSFAFVQRLGRKREDLFFYFSIDNNSPVTSWAIGQGEGVEVSQVKKRRKRCNSGLKFFSSFHFASPFLSPNSRRLIFQPKAFLNSAILFYLQFSGIAQFSCLYADAKHFVYTS